MEPVKTFSYVIGDDTERLRITQSLSTMPLGDGSCQLVRKGSGNSAIAVAKGTCSTRVGEVNHCHARQVDENGRTVVSAVCSIHDTVQ